MNKQMVSLFTPLAGLISNYKDMSFHNIQQRLLLLQTYMYKLKVDRISKIKGWMEIWSLFFSSPIMAVVSIQVLET